MVPQVVFEHAGKLIEMVVEVPVGDDRAAEDVPHGQRVFLVLIGRLHLVVHQEVIAGRSVQQGVLVRAHDDHREIRSPCIQCLPAHLLRVQIQSAEAGHPPGKANHGPLSRQRVRHLFLNHQLDPQGQVSEGLAPNLKLPGNGLNFLRVFARPVAHRPVVQVVVGVNHSGRDRLALQVQLTGLRTGKAQHLRIAPQELNLVAPDRHGFEGPARRVIQGGVIHGDNLAVINNEVWVSHQL